MSKLTDIIISFETAKLSKEKGFSWDHYNAIYNAGSINYRSCFNKDGNLINPKIYLPTNEHYPAPTINLLKDWIMDMFNYYVVVIPIVSEAEERLWKYQIYDNKNGEIIEDSLLFWSSYFDALENGIVYTLNQYIKVPCEPIVPPTPPSPINKICPDNVIGKTILQDRGIDCGMDITECKVTEEIKNN